MLAAVPSPRGVPRSLLLDINPQPPASLPGLRAPPPPCRVAFVLLEDFDQPDPRGIVDTVEAGVLEGQ